MFEIHVPCEKLASARVFDDFVLPRPIRPPQRVATRRCFGRAGGSKHKCLGASETSTNHAIWAARGRLGGRKTCQNSNAGSLFWQLKGEHYISADDCGAIVGLVRYPAGSPTDAANHLTWVAPLGSASKNHFKIRILERFFKPKGSAKGARERTSNR